MTRLKNFHGYLMKVFLINNHFKLTQLFFIFIFWFLEIPEKKTYFVRFFKFKHQKTYLISYILTSFFHIIDVNKKFVSDQHKHKLQCDVILFIAEEVNVIIIKKCAPSSIISDVVRKNNTSR